MDMPKKKLRKLLFFNTFFIYIKKYTYLSRHFGLIYLNILNKSNCVLEYNFNFQALICIKQKIIF
jgi:hypothetical protein